MLGVCALHTRRRRFCKLPFFKELKSFKNSNFTLRVILLGIIQIQRSFNLQIVRNVWTDFFHVIQRILQQAAPGQRSRAGRALDGGFLLWPTEWSSFVGGLHTRDPSFAFVVFQLFFKLILFCFIFFAVNTMSLLGIQTTICVSLNSK